MLEGKKCWLDEATMAAVVEWFWVTVIISAPTKTIPEQFSVKEVLYMKISLVAVGAFECSILIKVL